MGNKNLRPDPTDPFAPFNDDQKSYLKDKFESLCDQKKFLSSKKISEQLKINESEATKVITYIDFEGKGQVDDYEFICAAASLHQDDEQAQQFLFDLFKDGQEMKQQAFQSFFKSVFNYLKFMNLIKEQYTDKIGEEKFKQFDLNKNGNFSLDQFRSLLEKDYHCRLWMETLGFSAQREVERVQKPQNDQIENDDFKVQADQGDQAGSTPSWIQTAKKMANDKQPIKKRTNAPNQKLDINYVYGYRSYDTRSNLKYSGNGQIIYHTAACGIILNKIKNTQKINTDHNDDITCLDINVKKNIVATGQMGKKPAVIIWDATTAQKKVVFQNKLEKSIACISISPSGRYVAATSMSDNHEIAVYDIVQKALIAYGKGPRSVIYQIKFNTSQDQIICACAKQVIFAHFSKGKLECKKGIFGKAPCLPCLSIAVLKNNDCIVSMQNGLLTLWKGNSCTKIFKEHSKAVSALCERQNGGIISGDLQGNLTLWSENMSVEKQYDLKKMLGTSVKYNNLKVISLCEQSSNILVGTRGGQIYEINSKGNASLLIQGHYDEQLWGLTVNSSKHTFFTGGQDKLLLKWDMGMRKCIDKKKLDSAINSLDLSTQNILAVGMKNGIVNLFDGNNLKLLNSFFKHKNPDKDMISVVKFSPSGKKLAVAYTPPNSQVYIYDFSDTNAKPKTCKGSPSRIFSIDFSRNQKAILINNSSYEILFYDSSTGGQKTSATQFKGQEWATVTARFSWATQGIWPPCSDGSDINTVDRSNSKKYLATGDDFSTIKIFDYPVCQSKQISNKNKGHSSHITGVKWSFDDKYLISTGGLQKSIIQWTNTDEQDIRYDDVDIEQQNDNKQEGNKNQPNDQQQYELDEIQEDKLKYTKNLPAKKAEIIDDGDFQVEEDQGDQAGCVKPFLGQVNYSTPPQFVNPGKKNSAPEQDLTIKQVWGVRNQYLTDRVRNQVRYSSSYKSCLFITAAVGVQMNLNSKQQTFYRGQSEDLISFAISSDKKYCATGQMAQLNKNAPKDKIVEVHVWDVESKTKKSVLSKFHKRGIVLVSFSPSGERLLTIGQDDMNSLAVYDWKIQRKQWNAGVCGAKVTDAAWKNQTEYITCGLKHIKFWNKQKGTMGKISGSSKWDPMLSAVYWKDKDKFVTGGTSGTVYLWSGNTGMPTKEHTHRVDCFSIDSSGSLYSGDASGRIISWKISGGKLTKQNQILNVAKFDKIDAGVLSIDFSPQNKMLICTNSSTIYEVQKSTPTTIMQSHCKGQLWAQSWSPNSTQFVSAGDDKTIRIYDTQNFMQKYIYQMSQQVRGLDWEQSKGDLIIVGDYKGKIFLFNNKLQLLSEIKTVFSKSKPRQQSYWIEDIKFSPNGNHVAFGAHGGASHIQIYDIEDNKIKTGPKVIKNVFSSALLTLDWSQGSDIIAAVSQAYELQFVNFQGTVKASSVKTVKWASWSSKFGYQAKQIHQDVDYTNINAVCVSPTRTLVASGGDDQKIRLFNYPVNIPKQKHKQYTGHSSHVTRVRFSPDQSSLLSVGGNDRTIILWDVNGGKAVKKQNKKVVEQEVSDVEQPQDVNEDDEDRSQEEIMVPRARQEKIKQKPKQTDDFEVQEDQGDQFMAVKPWKGALIAPTNEGYKSTGKAPSVQLQIQYAHGYRTKDCRNNLKYVDQGKIAYHTAGLGVIMDLNGSKKQQKFFDMHNDDIISFYQNKKSRDLLYTGQMGAKNTVYCWNAEGQKVKQFKGGKKGISAVLANQNYVVAACLDDDHEVYLWDFKSSKLIKSQKGGKQVIIGMQWTGDKQFVSIGVNHYKIWEINGSTLKGQLGKNKSTFCAVSVKLPNIYVGTSDGSLQVWQGKSCSKKYDLHKGSAIHAIYTGQQILMTGGSDYNINIVSLKDMNVIQTIKCGQLLKDSIKPAIRSLDVWQDKILVGTLGSEIYQIQANNDVQSTTESTKFTLDSKLMSGHYAPHKVTNQVWGLALYKGSSYVTCSDDGSVRIWDIKSKQQLQRFELFFEKGSKPGQISQPKVKKFTDSVRGRCVCVSQQYFIVVGCKDGSLKIVNQKFEPIYCATVNDKKKQVSYVKFSPDGRLLAVGDHLGYISVYQWNGGKIKLKHRKIKHHSTIKHLDFSRDSTTIHSTCTSYQLLFWDSQSGAQKTSGASEMKNEEWATWNVTLGWPVQGVFEPFMDGSDVNAVDRSNQEHGNKKGMKLLASGDDNGKVRMLQYPCVKEKSQSVKGKGHSSHVTNVKFSSDDEFIISTGGQDQTIIQWRLISDN